MGFEIVLKDIIKSSGCSIEEIADKTDIPINTFKSYRSGRSKMPVNRLKILITFLESINRYDLIKQIFNYLDGGNWNFFYMGRKEILETPHDILLKGMVELSSLIISFRNISKPIAEWEKMKLKSHLQILISYCNDAIKLVEEERI